VTAAAEQIAFSDASYGVAPQTPELLKKMIWRFGMILRRTKPL
jgi:hypothetical protein